MYKIISYFILLLQGIFCTAQAPGIEWQNTIGGDIGDVLTITQTIESGYIIGGSSMSGISGDKTEDNLGNNDYWIIKLNSLGFIDWQNTIGGSGPDDLYCVDQTIDGGYILGGSSRSPISGDKSEASIAGSYDYWIVKLDSLGNIVWQNTIGGAGDDILYGVSQTQDGGYFLAGYSNSPISGDKTDATFSGSQDYWVLKLDPIGNIIWQKDIGGSNTDLLRSAIQTSDAGYLIGGYSNSGISGDKNEPNISGSNDFWILKLDSSGLIEWQNTIGGSQEDWLYDLEETFDNGYLVGGLSNSGISGDKTEINKGDYDFWVIKLDNSGNIQWQKTIGGSLSDVLNSLKQTQDEGYILGGYSSSGISGDKTEANIGFQDYWTIKLDNIGNILWQKTIGGWSNDVIQNIAQTLDNGYILGGNSLSPISGDKIEDNVGSQDFWIVKLFPEECTHITFYEDADDDGFGNNSDSLSACFAPLGYVLDNTDCNDLDSLVNPSSLEVCNDLDDNCNFIIDEGLPIYTYYEDADFDGFGNILSLIITCFDFPPLGFVEDSSDCDDTNNLIYVTIEYYADTDGDFFGDEFNSDLFCSLLPPAGFVIDSTDCDDTNPEIYPGAVEILNNLDDNCNDLIDEGVTINEINNIIMVEIFPNPNNGKFEIKLGDINTKETKIGIFNMLGKAILFESCHNINSIEINLREQLNEPLIIHIQSENYSLIKLIDIIQ